MRGNRETWQGAPAAGLIFLLLLVPGRGARPEEPPLSAGEAGRGAPLPGLVAQLRSRVDPAVTLRRIDQAPSLAIFAGAVHPRLPPGPFEITWTGQLRVDEEGGLRLAAFLRGEVVITVGGEEVLRGRGAAGAGRIEGSSFLRREPGLHPIRIHFTAPPDLPAQLQVWWEGEGFAREPLPPWRLEHTEGDAAEWRREELPVELGRRHAHELGCPRCHAASFPGLATPPPGPTLREGSPERFRPSRSWLLRWLAEPRALRPGATMPALFSADRAGDLERWAVTARLLGGAGSGGAAAPRGEAPRNPTGDHRMGLRFFASLGCAACHFLPDRDLSEQPARGQSALDGLADRYDEASLAAFLLDPSARYPDGRMPALPLATSQARDIAAFLLLWSRSSASEEIAPPAPEEIEALLRKLDVKSLEEAGERLLSRKRCGACHPGLPGGEGSPGPPGAAQVALRAERPDATGCLGTATLPRFALSGETQAELTSYLRVGAREVHPSPLETRRWTLERAGCVRCHRRNEERLSPLEEAGSALGGAWLQVLPYQRVPRLHSPHQKLTWPALRNALRDGVQGLRAASFTYLMPRYGDLAPELELALREADGELEGALEEPLHTGDPTLGSLDGARLVGFQGYACFSCHVWRGKTLSVADPGSVAPDLTRAKGRLRSPWIRRLLEDPQRPHPGTPMPAFFPRGRPVALGDVLGGDRERQLDAVLAYLELGEAGPEPRPPPPHQVDAPAPGEPVLAAQIPVRIPGRKGIESLTLLDGFGNIAVFDLGTGEVAGVFTGARVLRGVEGRLRTFTVQGTQVEAPELEALRAPPDSFRSFERLPDGVLVRHGADRASEVVTSVRLVREGGATWLVRSRGPSGSETRQRLPPADSSWTPAEPRGPGEPGGPAGARPGYRAWVYPREQTAAGEDLLLPGAVATERSSGSVLVACMKTGRLLRVEDPADSVVGARFADAARGLFQEAYSLLAEPGALFILHRRNLTRALDRDHDGVLETFERVALLPQATADAYDYGYGLARNATGRLVVSLAPHANQHLTGSGGALEVEESTGKLTPVAHGFRNPLGWCTGPDKQVFFTDNQGEWVPTNKLCHLAPGRYYGYPNAAQREHTSKPPGNAAVWVPYAWAKSINGVTYDDTEGKFGPFAGQFFLAELMFGGAIVRASLEKVNGEYQGCCFPFWGTGLLGPLSLAFDARGRLIVGSITEPGWMAQPDRGALYRIDFTGEVPFEIATIRALPRGFRLELTLPADRGTLESPASYRVERYRYEHTGAYGSPELDRKDVPVLGAIPAPDLRSIVLELGELTAGFVYRIAAEGVRSGEGRPLHEAVGAYTLNAVPLEVR